MPVPFFNSDGILPPVSRDNATSFDRSPYAVTMLDIVERFGTTKQRRQLIRNLIAYRQLLSSAGYISGTQFIDGSFVEDVENLRGRGPDDIDVLSFLKAPPIYVQNPSLWQVGGFSFWQNEVQNSIKNKNRFKLDTYAILIDELPFDDLLKGIIYWYGLFSHQRETFAWKGFVTVELNHALDVAALNELGGN